MATLQIRIDDETKTEADSLFGGLGLDTPTAVRMFIAAALEHDGIPFPIKRKMREPNAELRQALTDIAQRKDLHGPFSSAEAAIAAMLSD